MTSVQGLLLTRHTVAQHTLKVSATSALLNDGTPLPLAADTGTWLLFAKTLPLDQGLNKLMPVSLPPGLEPPPAHCFASPCALVQWANRAKEKHKPVTTLHAYKRALAAPVTPPSPRVQTPAPEPQSSDDDLSSQASDEDEDSEQEDSDAEAE